jgi:hypothetical protein
MNSSDYGRGMVTKLTTWKSKIYDLIGKIAWRGSKEREKVLSDNQDLNMSISEGLLVSYTSITSPNEWASQMKNIDNGFVDMRGKYVLLTRASWTGLYGKEPWPRERKVWEKV